MPRRGDASERGAAAAAGRMTDDADMSLANAWDVQPVPRLVVAIGDLHGDLRAFGAIAHACGLLDARGSWCGGDAHLVVMGDLVGGPHSRLLIRALMRLAPEALLAGGRVHVLLGNHDLLPITGRFEKMTPGERQQYAADDFRRRGPFADWVRGRPAIVRIGRSVFAHAGLEAWALKHDPGEVNAQVRAWIAWYQGNGPQPSALTHWVIADRGPLGTRAFKMDSRKAMDPPAPETIRAILARLEADRLVLGHSPTPDGSLVMDHPRYGTSVVLVDTRISDRARGRLGALVLTEGVPRAVYVEDRVAGHGLHAREARAEARRVSLAGQALDAVARLFGRRRPD